VSAPRRILIVGSGAREHALAWRLANEAGVEKVACAPGNPLMRDVAEIWPAVSASDHAALLDLARAMRTELVVVGPESPLVAGLADRLGDAGIACFGPTAAAARLEGSKAFARDVCRQAGVPMAEGKAFRDVLPALAYADELGLPLVVKADGLAAGKGVALCDTAAQVEFAVRDALEGGRFGLAGLRVVIERRLDGREASVIALCDGLTSVLLPAARDHKRLADADNGPNTGGMGAFSPLDELGPAALSRIRATVHQPVLEEMARRGTRFRGALYAGLMLTADGPQVLEFNVRLGDPETQAILPRLAAPLAPLLAAAAGGTLAGALAEMGLDDSVLPQTADATAAITLAAAGYPDAPRAGDVIAGIEAAQAAGGLVFGAGVALDQRGITTAGGRVLTVVGRGPDVARAADAAYAAADQVSFEGRLLRRDIGRSLAIAGEAA
jgi:phosphoribosylamine---glycine ligase